MKRTSGVLLHISSLPGEYGIGTLGKEARKFADFLKSGGFAYWQILPVNEADECNSPYKSPSAFAGNPFFIDLETLVSDGLLHKEEILPLKQKTPYLCEFDLIKKTRMPILRKAFSRIDAKTKKTIESFKNENPWVSEYASFMALKNKNEDAAPQKWETVSLEEADITETEFYIFLQYEFFSQWKEFKDYANGIGIKIIGDMPIYVSYESADVFYNSKIFKLNKKGEMVCEAGVPPDYFSADGQAWGNPVYDWAALKKDKYAWWINRLAHSMKMYDMVRIDHFRGFAAYWEIPNGKKAVEGKWVKGPGINFFKTLTEQLPDLNIIAEDLGDIDQDVVDLLEATGFPGMRVMQFGFITDGDNPHLPHNYVNNSVAYTGTHDNNTTLGWLWELPPENRDYALKYCGYFGEKWKDGGPKSEAKRAIIKTLYQSGAGLVMLPVQDLCWFGKDTRINIPGKKDDNWAYRITWEQLSQIDMDWFLETNKLYGRN